MEIIWWNHQENNGIEKNYLFMYSRSFNTLLTNILRRFKMLFSIWISLLTLSISAAAYLPYTLDFLCDNLHLQSILQAWDQLTYSRSTHNSSSFPIFPRNVHQTNRRKYVNDTSKHDHVDFIIFLFIIY